MVPNKSHKNWIMLLSQIRSGITKNHKNWIRLRSIIVDFMIIASVAALAFYRALDSVTGIQYAGSGFQYSNQSLIESVILLVIFCLGISRLVIDLRSREF
ncbi:MAG: hypothetical protein A2Z38_07640 [Planctomycetes bacterium RBG_19FT_COMBO_48_8]|nr:MAG: hypothetical protein A2Z38_07640 [Planctomycetes bacterium RBG_19FT_COMBO_48_8]